MQIDFRISPKVHQLVKSLHKEYPAREWSGIGKVHKEVGYYELVDIIFPQQDNGPATTELTEDGMVNLMDRICETDIDNLGEYRCWIHSHHTMQCFWSGTDDATKLSFNDGNQNFWFSVVTAIKGGRVDYLGALNVYKPILAEFKFIPSISELKDEEIDTEYTNLISGLQKTEPDMSRFNELVDIFNVEEDDENMEAIKALVLDEHKKSIEKRINAMLRLWEQALDEKILPTYNDFIEERLTELKANILVKSYPQQIGYWSKKQKKRLRAQGLRDEINQRPYSYAVHLFNDNPDDINDIDDDDDNEWTTLEKEIRGRMNKDVFEGAEFVGNISGTDFRYKENSVWMYRDGRYLKLIMNNGLYMYTDGGYPKFLSSKYSQEILDTVREFRLARGYNF